MLICDRTGGCTCSQHLLIYSIEVGNNSIAKSYLRELANFGDLVDSKGRNLLHLSVEYDNAEIVEYLIYQGLNVNARDNDGITPLMLAAKNEKVATVEVLLKNNADIYLSELSGVSSLQHAVNRRLSSSSRMCLKQPSHVILEMFFDKINKDFRTNTAETKRSLLNESQPVKFIALAIGSIEVAKYILESGFRSNYTEPQHGFGILAWTVIFEKVENAKVIIENEVNIIDSIDRFGYCYTENNFAYVDENSAILKMWLKRVAEKLTDSNAREQDRVKSQLKNLLMCGNEKTVRVILESEIDIVSMKFDLSKTFLHLLIENKNSDVIEILDELDIKFNVNSVDSHGETALMLAVQSGDLKNVEFLLKHGAYVNLTDWNGISVLQATTNVIVTNQEVMAKIITLLLQYGAKAQTVFDNGKTILDVLYPDDKRTNVIIAHLALLGSLDRPTLTALSLNKIKYKRGFQALFDLCTKQLERMKNIPVHGRVTLFKLLTEGDEKLVSYVHNSELILAFNCMMERLSDKIQSYYFDTLQQRIAKALNTVELEKKAALAIEELTGLCSDVYHAIIYKIMSYLSPQDLNNLRKLKEIMLKME